MRLAAFIVVGIVLGVVVARLNGPRHHPPAAADAQVMPGAGTKQRLQRRDSASEPVARQRDLQPSDARYDPVALRKQEGEEIRTRDIYEAEPRDPAFAPVLEQRARTAIGIILRELQLEDKVRAVHIDCRTLSCFTSIEVARSNGPEVYEAINGIMMGDVQTPGLDEADPERSYVTFVNLHRPSTRDDAYYRQLLAEAMRPALEVAKQRRPRDPHEVAR